MKYYESKSKIANSILSFIHSYIMLNNIDTYIEPFVGGCNIIDKVVCTNKFAYDKNKYLIELLRYLQNGGELPDEITREQYMDCKAHYNANDKYYPDWLLGAVGFLAGTGNKLYDGTYINSRSDYKDEKEALIEQIRSLTDVEFNCEDYKNLHPKNCLIYSDPPCSGSKGYESVSKEFNYKEFWDIMREWSKDNIVLISEKCAPDDFDIIWEQETDNTSDTKNRVTEKLFIHKSLNIDDNSDFDF